MNSLRLGSPVLCLVGPTASGKSSVAMALSQHWPVSIISVDSALVYRGMDIGTAKPTPQERQLVPHYCIDLVDPADRYSAARFATDASAAAQHAQSQGRIPIFVGGTLLYLQSLIVGLNDLPQANPAVRAELEEEARLRGWPALHAQLATIDPVTASRVKPQDGQRIQRAMEVHRLTGRPMSSLIGNGIVDPVPGDIHLVSLEPLDRTALHRRIEQRFDRMIDAGFLDEVARLKRRGDLIESLPSMRCVGYRQAWQHLDGATSYAEFREASLAATRQLAKRQLTWLRHWEHRVAIDCIASDATERALLACSAVLSNNRAASEAA